MKDAQELYEEWTSGESTGLRPQRVKRLRDAIQHHTGIPVPRSVRGIEAWLPDYKGQVTRRLREHPDVNGDDSEE